MKNKQIALAVFFGAAFGCAGNQLVNVATTDAQAGPGQFRECVNYPLGFDNDHEDLGAEAKSIVGWTPVGGTSHGVALCR